MPGRVWWSQKDPIAIANMKNFFSNFSQLTLADVSGISPNSRNDNPYAPYCLQGTFAYCRQLKRLEGVEMWDVSKAQELENTFRECSVLEDLDISAWDLKSATAFFCTFYEDASLKRIRCGKWNLQKVTNMFLVFNNCVALEEITNMESWYFGRTVDLGSSFGYLKKLKKFDTSLWGMYSSPVRNISTIFRGFENLEYLDLSGMRIDIATQNDSNEFDWSKNTSLKTFVISNRIRITGNIYNAPFAAHQVSPDTYTQIFPSWVNTDTGDVFGRLSLCEFMATHYSSDNTAPLQKYRFVAAGENSFTSQEPYLAIYSGNNYSCMLVVDAGSEINTTRDGKNLAYAARRFWLDDFEGRKWADKAWRIDSVEICIPLCPSSTKQWFQDIPAKTIKGLEKLDMSHCLNVENMFRGATKIEGFRFNGAVWNMNPQVINYSNMFNDSSLEQLDVSSWTFMKNELNLSGSYLEKLHTITYPLTPGAALPFYTRYIGSEVMFNDGLWYINGYGEGRTALDTYIFLDSQKRDLPSVITLKRERLDRSYAAIYTKGESSLLVFGRGLDVSPSYLDYEHRQTYRGLEEPGKFDFANENRVPWESDAHNIDGVYATPESIATPILPRNTNRWFLSMDKLKSIDAINSGAIDPSKVKKRIMDVLLLHIAWQYTIFIS